MIDEFNHMGIVVRNLEKTLAFYQDLLGAEIVFRLEVASRRSGARHRTLHPVVGCSGSPGRRDAPLRRLPASIR